MIATRWSLGPRLDQLAGSPGPAGRTASAAAAAARRCWCRSARSAGRPAGRSVMIGQVMLWSIRSSLLNARSKSASRPLRRMCAARSSSPAQRHPRQAELALLVVPVGVEERRLADQELRHVVQPQLVEVVAADHHQDVGLGPGQRLAERLDLGDPLVGERRPVGAGGRAGPVVERVVRRGDDRGDGGHARLLPAQSSVGVDVDRVAVDGQVGVHADRAAALLGDLAEQPGGPGQQREAAQQLDRQAEVGQRGAADTGAVERQPAAEHLLVDAADRLEQPQVRPAQALLLGDPDQHRRARVLRPCAPGGRGPGRTCPASRVRRTAVERERVPAGVVGGQVAVVLARGRRAGSRRSPR